MCRAVMICGGGNDVVLLWCGEDGSGAEAGRGRWATDR